jgi:hypothetical protein
MGLQQRIAFFSAFLWFSVFAIASAQQRKVRKYPAKDKIHMRH